MGLTSAILSAELIGRAWLKFLSDHANSFFLVAGLVGHFWLTILLLRRRAYRVFRLFVFCQIYAVPAVASRLLTFIAGSPRAYYDTFWITELGFVVFSIAASYEVFLWVFSGFDQMPWFRWVTWGGIGITILISAINALLHDPANADRVFGRILQFSIVINSIQAAIFVLFFLLVKVLDIGFRRYPFGISLGLGIASVGTLIPYAARSEFGTGFDNVFFYAPTVAYFVSLLVWISAFLKSEPEAEAMSPPMRQEDMAEEVGQYVAVLKGFFGKKEE